ncbi:hypothetical protein [Parapedobacter lycopersici]|uniref:hypothetical protein n=1 Tax=Parapedobacter lycopersici TaxID=1864939 RepID=UPI00214DA19A|nr:hypothetical protein [Parapedobacter lycopersici]
MMENEQYITNPGTGSLFPTKQKKQPNSPDFYGDIVTPDGMKLKVSGWVRKAKSGLEYISLSVREDEPYVGNPTDIMSKAQSATIVSDEVEVAEVVDEKDDDLPF